MRKTLQKFERCITCAGEGSIKNIPCPACKGTGCAYKLEELYRLVDELHKKMRVETHYAIYCSLRDEHHWACELIDYLNKIKEKTMIRLEKNE